MADVTVTSSVDDLLHAASQAGSGLYTGRYIVTFKPGAREAAAVRLAAAAGRVASSRDFEAQAVNFAAVGDAQAVVFEEIGAAVMAAPPENRTAMLSSLGVAEADSPVQTIEPETFVFPSTPHDYLSGFAAAAARIRDDLGPVSGIAEVQPHQAAAEANNATWGLVATGAARSKYSGQGIGVAVLDTGFDLTHPDFVGRAITAQSFIPGETPQDVQGHGTHCIGTACGPLAPTGVPRYGTAYAANIFVGKVLSNSGSGTTATVLNGMNWAITNRCPVISMSLGAPIPMQAAYTQAGQVALDSGCLIIAAAGNESRRPGTIAPTGAPANSPTILSVAALDEALRVAFFSCGGKVEIAAPGVNVFSSYKMPQRYQTLMGTSMATPHVAGAAALTAQANPALRGRALWAALVQNARRLPIPASDVGAGLVQCP
jgi:subtilisin family serine protease